mgnify:FL=1
MITSQKNPGWPLDIPITGNARAGLKAPSKVRMKLFTLDTRLMVKKIGKLTTADKEAVVQALRSLLAGFFFFAFWLFRAFVMDFGSEVRKLDPRLFADRRDGAKMQTFVAILK